MVEQLYANVDVSAQLKDQLPNNLQGLSGPIAGISRELADRAAAELLSGPRCSSSSYGVASAAQPQLIEVLENKTDASRHDERQRRPRHPPARAPAGRPLPVRDNLDERVPQDAGQVTLLAVRRPRPRRPSRSGSRRRPTGSGCSRSRRWAAAALARPRPASQGGPGDRIGLVIAGSRARDPLSGNYIVDNVVVTESVRPAAATVGDRHRRLAAPPGTRRRRV